ncbi:MAG: N-6 DNA methylase, partial [Propionibacteriaceae bacterium]|nr:N-6 DNA methylase [Propionibacteriaceae bacterium]
MSATQAIRIEGGIVPASLLQLLRGGTLGSDESRSPESYHIVGRQTVPDAVNRAWSYLVGAWEAWTDAQAREGGMESTSAALARERWLLPLFQELGYGRLTSSQGVVIEDDQRYPVSHEWNNIPIHLVGPGVKLDKRNPGVQGAARAPQAMVQELLNRDETRLWALLSNGLRLRLLRDSTALAGSAYVEFDLQAIFSGELFSEFMMLWQLCHESRLEPRPGSEGEPVSTRCWLEQWREDSIETGTRALDQLRGGVERALEHLGSGFLAHQANGSLRQALSNGSLTATTYHRHLLRLVYRLLFLFVAEDRDVLLDPSAPQLARERYDSYFSTRRLRQQAQSRHGSVAYGDLWQAQVIVLKALGGNGQPELALPALGGLFDSETEAADPFRDASLGNDALLAAVRDLGWFQSGQRLQAVDYRNLGAEELGSVYESLLELVPQVMVDDRHYRLVAVSGNERKTTGSYYTPSSLVSALLDTALDPVIEQAVRTSRSDSAEAERRLLNLTICDPACGSGHFLVAGARRLARRLAAIRSGEDEPTPDAVRHALRDVIGRCVYGVDLNPLAAELAKVSLWLEATEPGKPLGFLDSRVRVGNALLGATPALLSAGLPDGAFSVLEGDDKATASAAKKRNAGERGGQDELFVLETTTSSLVRLHQELLGTPDNVSAVRTQARKWRQFERSEEYQGQKLRADAWMSAFVWHKRTDENSVPVPTSATIRHIEATPFADNLAVYRQEVAAITAQYHFFHWHIEFPEVFDRPGQDKSPEGWTGGFDVMIGNPPWERVKLQEQEFFAARDGDIANAPNKAARSKLIAKLQHSESLADQQLYVEFIASRRQAEGESVFLHHSGRYPLAGRGDVNTYAVFAELFSTLVAPTGQAGVIVPTGIATDATTQYYFKDLVTHQRIRCLYDFENAAPIFGGVHRSFKFCLLTTTGRRTQLAQPKFAFFLHDARDIEATSFTMTPKEITLVNPNTGTLPIFRTRRDAEITLGIYHRVPVLLREGDPDCNPWGIRFMRMFDMSNDSHLFYTREELEADGWVLNGNVFERLITDRQTDRQT